MKQACPPRCATYRLGRRLCGRVAALAHCFGRALRLLELATFRFGQLRLGLGRRAAPALRLRGGRRRLRRLGRSGRGGRRGRGRRGRGRRRRRCRPSHGRGARLARRRRVASGVVRQRLRVATRQRVQRCALRAASTAGLFAQPSRAAAAAARSPAASRAHLGLRAPRRVAPRQRRGNAGQSRAHAALGGSASQG